MFEILKISLLPVASAAAAMAAPGGWQLDLLLWLQSARSPLLTWLMGSLTMLGDDLFYVAVLTLMYWAGDRRGAYGRQKTFDLMRLVVLSVLINIALKNVVDASRPFAAVPSLEGLWTFTAGGASFPSGHAQTAATFWLALARTGASGVSVRAGREDGKATIGRQRFNILAALMVALISLSRLYLGVHWPQDVLAGVAVGSALGLFGPGLLRLLGPWFPLPAFLLSAAGILIFRDHGAVQLTCLLIGASLGHRRTVSQIEKVTQVKTRLSGSGADPAWRFSGSKTARQMLGVLAVAVAYGLTTWLLTGLGLPEVAVEAVATLETGLMITWGVPAFVERGSDPK